MSHKPLNALLLAAGFILGLTASSGAYEIKSNIDPGRTVQPLRPNGMLIIGGQTHGRTTDPATRPCYGSTRCKESGSYYTEDGILNYKNGTQPPVQRKPASNPAGKK